jgi:hypothetical protein
MRNLRQVDSSTHGARRSLKTVAAIALLAALAACSGDQVNRLVGTSLRSWCQNTPDHCSVSADRS